WVERFCVTILRSHNRTRRNYTKIIGSRNEEELQEILAEVMLRRTLKDTGLDLPPIIWQTVMLDTFRDLTGADADVDAGLQAMLQAGASPQDLPNDAEVAKLRHTIGRLKVEPFMRLLLDEMERTDEKVVIFAHHRDV